MNAQRVEDTSSDPGGIELELASSDDLDDLATRLRTAFTAAAVRGFGYSLNEPIPTDADVRAALRGDGVEVLHVLFGGKPVGAAVVSIDNESGTNSLDLFFIDGSGQNSGLGFCAWKAIEARYPQTRVWRTMTPYFDTRNIHFYVNKCGFRIVEFFHPGHLDPNEPTADNRDVAPQNTTDLMFAFEKQMQ